MERIARDSEKDHWQVMEVLTAFVREESPHSEDKPSTQPITSDIQAILTVVGRRKPKYDLKGLRLDLSETHLHGARLTGANLRTASLYNVNFQGAIFQNTILHGTNFHGSSLNQCLFERAHLLDANIEGCEIRNADFSEAVNLTKEQVTSAIGSESAELPAYVQDARHAQADTLPHGNTG